MVNIDMTQPDRALVPGIDLWEIMKSEDEKSSKGDAMLSLKLFRVSNKADHIFDSVMLAGNGWSIGKKKLGALLPADFKGNLDPLNLVGVRLWVSTTIDSYNGKERLKVNISELKHGGFQKAADVPPGCALPEEPAVEPSPF